MKPCQKCVPQTPLRPPGIKPNSFAVTNCREPPLRQVWRRLLPPPSPNSQITSGSCQPERARSPLRPWTIFVFLRLHRCLEAANPVSQPLTQFRQFLRTKHKQSNSKDHDQMHRLKQSFNHISSWYRTKSAAFPNVRFPTRPRATIFLAAV